MSKPWEEEWRAEGASWVERRADTVTIAHIQTGAVEERAVYTHFLAAAPDMARTLLEAERVLKAWHKDRGEWATLREQIRSSLTKAGVLP